jgi:uncharacterized membrane-anchored protein
MLIVAILTLVYIIVGLLCLGVAGLVYMEDEPGAAPLVFIGALLLVAAAFCAGITIADIQDYSCLAESILKE